MSSKFPVWYYSTSVFVWLISLILIDDFGVGFTGLVSVLMLWQTIRIFTTPTILSVRFINVVTLLGAVTTASLIGLKNSVNVFVALMLIASLLKQIHATKANQFTQICILNFFTYPCLFLFTQSLFAALLVLCMLAVNLAIMLNLEQSLKLKPALKVSIKGLIIVLPVAAFLVVFLPKLPAFWQLPQPQKEAKTGLSENVDPFDIVSLSQSEELVFRATFENEQIEGPYYWRAIIHDEFDGKRWKISEYQRTNMKPPSLDEGEHATIIAQPSHIPWLYGLSYSYSNNPKLNSNVFGTVYLKSLTSKPIEYSIMVSDFSPESTLKPWYYQRNVKIPKGFNPKTTQLAQTWVMSSSNTSEFIEKMRLYFLNNQFIYTLTPTPSQSDNRVDEFLFNTQNGFCGHYASAAAFLLRSANIPARLVSGYLGGEQNKNQGYYSVYQYDAHAWVEYFTPGVGWQRLDPTAWIAPERMTGSLSQLAQLSNEFQQGLGYSLIAFSNWHSINWVRLKLEELDYQWTRVVINFDRDKQSRLFKNWFGKYGTLWAGIISLLIFAILSVILFFLVNYIRRATPPIELAYYNDIVRYLNRDSHSGSVRQNIQELTQLLPENEKVLWQFYALFEKSQYQQKPLSKAELKKLKTLYRQIKKKG
ncbi:transglutaminase family protein [Pseudoalteromonas peptidolytica]|uniref:transglutaminase family protein n=1 Tax=Pseudoalteromonas peptidolytica TaxID=61150 RepID=UPI00298E744E|nr:DUF3488 and transglutaminase-like domain-containing protein [Pseudoalteromonas peptidolytica]MDW7550545.1 DUF3488 and transglutaminase-like domain-containing protein [Pseudoalteromonas peptidolytica]